MRATDPARFNASQAENTFVSCGNGVLVCNCTPAELCESASCGEVFLLASAALANITFFDSMACEILLQLNAIQILLQACRDRQRVDTPYSKDQVRGVE